MYLLIDLYNGSNTIINDDEAWGYKDGEHVVDAKELWRGEEYILIKMN
jgi:hypothetical protein